MLLLFFFLYGVLVLGSHYQAEVTFQADQIFFFALIVRLMAFSGLVWSQKSVHFWSRIKHVCD